MGSFVRRSRLEDKLLTFAKLQIASGYVFVNCDRKEG